MILDFCCAKEVSDVVYVICSEDNKSDPDYYSEFSTTPLPGWNSVYKVIVGNGGAVKKIPILTKINKKTNYASISVIGKDTCFFTAGDNVLYLYNQGKLEAWSSMHRAGTLTSVTSRTTSHCYVIAEDGKLLFFTGPDTWVHVNANVPYLPQHSIYRTMIEDLEGNLFVITKNRQYVNIINGNQNIGFLEFPITQDYKYVNPLFGLSFDAKNNIPLATDKNYTLYPIFYKRVADGWKKEFGNSVTSAGFCASSFGNYTFSIMGDDKLSYCSNSYYSICPKPGQCGKSLSTLLMPISFEKTIGEYYECGNSVTQKVMEGDRLIFIECPFVESGICYSITDRGVIRKHTLTNDDKGGKFDTVKLAL